MPSKQQEAFVDRFSSFAFDVSQVTGIAPEVVLGQAALETGWGKSIAGNNVFGIKGKGQQVVTHEDIPGKGLVKTTESFRAYDNPFESFMDYGRLMGTGRYSGVKGTVEDQVAAIGRSGYATDRNYASKLGAVVNSIQEMTGFQTALQGWQTSLVDEMAGVPDLPGDLIGMPDWGLAPPDLPGALSDLDVYGPPAYGDVAMPDVPDVPDVMGQFDGPVFDSITQGVPGFDPLADFSVSVPDVPNVMGQLDGPTYGDLTADAFGLSSLPDVPSVPDPMATMDGPTYADISQDVYSDAPPAADVSVPSVPDVGPVDLASYGPSLSDMGYGISGHHAGFDGFAPTPDFSEKSLDQKTQEAFAQDRIDNVLGGKPGSVTNPGIPDFDKMAADLTAEILGDAAPKAIGDIDLGEEVAAAPKATPASAPAPPSRPTEAVRATPQAAPRAAPTVSRPAPPATLPALTPVEIPDVALAPSFSSLSQPPSNSLSDQYGMGKAGFDSFLGGLHSGDKAARSAVNDFGLGYAADALVSSGPYAASVGYNDLVNSRIGEDFGLSPTKGLTDDMPGWATGGLKGAALGALTGGLPGALTGGLLGAVKPSVEDLLSELLGGLGGGGSSFGGFDIGDVTSPDGYAGLGAAVDNFMGGLGGGGGSIGSSSGGGWGGWGADPSSDPTNSRY
jgi:hypothetical protein